MPKKEIFMTPEGERAHFLFASIHENLELNELEFQGFLRGEKRGKTMNVPFDTIKESLYKQESDLCHAIGKGDKEEIKKAIANLRTVVGCLFLKMQEMEKEKNKNE